HLGVEEQRLREGAPWTAEIRLDAFGARDPSAREDEAVRGLGRRRRRRELAVAPGGEAGALEPRGCAAEDEVDVPGDQRVLEVLPAAIEKDRVLPAEEPAVAEHHAIAVDAQRERLPVGSGGVLEGQVLGGEIVGVDDRRRRPERAHWLAVGTGIAGLQSVGQDRRRRIVPDEHHEPLFALDVEQLVVGAGPDGDDPPPRRGGLLRRGVDRLLDASILTAAISGHDRVNRRRRLTERRGRDEHGRGAQDRLNDHCPLPSALPQALCLCPVLALSPGPLPYALCQALSPCPLPSAPCRALSPAPLPSARQAIRRQTAPRSGGRAGCCGPG